MATVADLPPQYQPPCKALASALKGIVNIIADTTEGATGKQKANKIMKVHYLMQDAVTQIEQFLNAEGAAANLDDLVTAEIQKGIVDETAEAAPPTA